MANKPDTTILAISKQPESDYNQTVTDTKQMFKPKPQPTFEDATKAIKTLLQFLAFNPVGTDNPYYNPDNSSLAETPKRVVKALLEQTSGYMTNLDELFTVFDEKFDEMVVLRNIEFSSLCEHHLLPFIGTATVGYIAHGKVVGISKIARLVDCFSKRLQVQERIGVQIADALQEYLSPRGVGVVIVAKHQCMSCRGVMKQNSEMVTSVMRGLMKTDVKAREEFLRFLNSPKSLNGG